MKDFILRGDLEGEECCIFGNLHFICFPHPITHDQNI